MIFQVEIQFKLPGKVHGVAMSSVSTTHMLIAAGTEDVQVRLCDMASGAFTHTLSGHRGILQILFACVFTFYLVGSFWRSRLLLCLKCIYSGTGLNNVWPYFVLHS